MLFTMKYMSTSLSSAIVDSSDGGYAADAGRAGVLDASEERSERIDEASSFLIVYLALRPSLSSSKFKDTNLRMGSHFLTRSRHSGGAEGAFSWTSAMISSSGVFSPEEDAYSAKGDEDSDGRWGEGDVGVCARASASVRVSRRRCTAYFADFFAKSSASSCLPISLKRMHICKLSSRRRRFKGSTSASQRRGR